VFSDARIVGDGISVELYTDQHGAVRGDLDYIMSRGELCDFDVCPSRWRRGYRDVPTSATEWGQLIDCLALSPREYASRVAVKPKTYTNEDGEEKKWSGNSKACKAWLQEQAGKLVVGYSDASDAAQAAEVLSADSQIAGLLRDSKKQVMVSAYWVDKETRGAIQVRGLIDLVAPSDMLLDLKTCNSAHPNAWAKAVFEHDYHTQAALYLDLYNAATGEQRNEFRHILQESYKPWQVAKRILSAEYLSIGRAKYQRILKRYAKCLKDNQWPDYDEPENHELVIDGWKVTQPADWMLLQ
jgi:hypothetical protein